jgi:6-phosphofructokinase
MNLSSWTEIGGVQRLTVLTSGGDAPGMNAAPLVGGSRVVSIFAVVGKRGRGCRAIHAGLTGHDRAAVTID